MRCARPLLPVALIVGCSVKTPPTSPETEPDPPAAAVHQPPSSADDPASSGQDRSSIEEEASASGQSESGEGDPADDTLAVAPETNECQGTANEELLAALRSRGAASRSCFESLLERGTEARGQIKVALKVTEAGHVEAFDLEGDDVEDSIFTECLAEHFKVPYTEFPPDGGCVTVKIPLNFTVKKATKD